jgi:hypothetical protein
MSSFALPGMLISCGLLSAPDALSDAVVELTAEQIVSRDFLGFGAEWDANGYLFYELDGAEHAIEAQRVQWMRLPIARVMMLTKWCYNEGVFTWDSPGMKALYRILEVCQASGTAVFLTDWGGREGVDQGAGNQRRG